MGIQISGTSGSNSSSPDQMNYLVNNNIQSVSRYALVYEPHINILSTAVGNRIAHNYLYDTPQMAVQFQGYRNTYEYNNANDYGTITNDTGSFYSYGDNYGNDVFRYNFSHDTPTSNAITYDGFSSTGSTRNVTGQFYGNLSLMNSSCEGESLGLALCVGASAYNNVSIGGGRYGSFQFYTTPQSNIHNNAAVEGYYPPDFDFELVTVVNGSNEYTTSTNSVIAENGPNLSYSSDPGFLNLATEDLRLKPTCSFYGDMPGFANIPFEMIGLYNDGYRSNAPGYAPFITSTTPSAASAGLVYCERATLLPDCFRHNHDPPLLRSI